MSAQSRSPKLPKWAQIGKSICKDLYAERQALLDALEARKCEYRVEEWTKLGENICESSCKLEKLIREAKLYEYREYSVDNIPEELKAALDGIPAGEAPEFFQLERSLLDKEKEDAEKMRSEVHVAEGILLKSRQFRSELDEGEGWKPFDPRADREEDFEDKMKRSCFARAIHILEKLKDRGCDLRTYKSTSSLLTQFLVGTDEAFRIRRIEEELLPAFAGLSAEERDSVIEHVLVNGESKNVNGDMKKRYMEAMKQV